MHCLLSFINCKIKYYFLSIDSLNFTSAVEVSEPS